MLPRTIQTERLLLAPANRGHARAIYRAYAQDEEVTRFLQWAPHKTLDETRRFLATCEINWEHGSRYPYVIIPNTEEDPAGMIEVHPIASGYIMECGYVLARPYWGSGLMTEALSAVIRDCFNIPGVYRFQAFCHTANTASARVMEKNGMRLEGVLRRYHKTHAEEQPVDVCLYAIVRDDLKEQTVKG